jgi:hypothetical protein
MTFQKLHPSELRELYELELRYSELKHRVQRMTASDLPDDGYLDWHAKRTLQRLRAVVMNIGQRLYDLCRSVNLRSEMDFGGYAPCPKCVNENSGNWTGEESDLENYEGPTMYDNGDGTYTCEQCGQTLPAEKIYEAFPSGGTMEGGENIWHFMREWQQAGDDLPRRIIAIHELVNAIHGSGEMAPMFFEGDTADIRRRLDQLSGKNASREAVTRIAQMLDDAGVHDLADRMERVAMRPFREDLDVRDPEAYAELQRVTKDPRPIRHIQPGRVPLAVTPHTDLPERPARGWAQTTPYEASGNDIASLFQRSLIGSDYGQIMTSRQTGGGTPVHERFHIDHADRGWLSEHDLKRRVGQPGYGGSFYWNFSPEEIMAQVGQLLHAYENAPKTRDGEVALPPKWNGNIYKYLRLKSGVQNEGIVNAVIGLAQKIGWDRLVSLDPEIVAELIGRQQKFLLSALIPGDLEDPMSLMHAVPEKYTGRPEIASMLSDHQQKVSRQREEIQKAYEAAEWDEGTAKQDFWTAKPKYPERPQAIPSLAAIQAAGRAIEEIWADYNRDEANGRKSGSWDWRSRKRRQTYLMDQLYGVYSFASKMAFALDVERMTNVLNEMVNRGGLRRLPGEDLESELSEETLERVRRYATAKVEGPDGEPVEEIMPQRYENALVAAKLGVPLGLVQTILFAESDVENLGMEEAIGNVQDEIMGDAPDEDSIISVLPFLVGEAGNRQREHWLNNNMNHVREWRDQIELQPAIEGSVHDHQRVLDEWDRLTGDL